jgi:hypothetical protein
VEKQVPHGTYPKPGKEASPLGPYAFEVLDAFFPHVRGSDFHNNSKIKHAAPKILP